MYKFGEISKIDKFIFRDFSGGVWIIPASTGNYMEQTFCCVTAVLKFTPCWKLHMPSDQFAFTQEALLVRRAMTSKCQLLTVNQQET